MSNFSRRIFSLPVQVTRRSIDSDDYENDEESECSEQEDTAPLVSEKSRTYRNQAVIKTLNPHYLCPDPTCDHASARSAADLSLHWKRRHVGELWLVGNVRVVQNGQTFRWGYQKLHPKPTANTKTSKTPRINRDWTDEAIRRRAAYQVRSGSSEAMHKFEVDLLAASVKRERELRAEEKMSLEELDAKIAALKSALEEFTDERLARSAKNEEAAEKARGKGLRLAHKLHEWVGRGRKLFTRKDGTSFYRAGDRSLSPPPGTKRPMTAQEYRQRNPIPGGILRRPLILRIPNSDTANREIPNRNLPNRDNSLQVRFPSKFKGIKHPNETESSEEAQSEVSEEE